jgi:KUP system potassium uptake protein
MDNVANGPPAAEASRTSHSRGPGTLALAVGSVGVVYGDIGTSPLYAFREAVNAAGPVTRDTVLGVLSLILWALIIVVTVKYVLLLLRADNNGEGGTLSLMALATRALGRRTFPIFLLGVIGASMFIGDSMITPAISVLSAVEGLKLATPAFDKFVVPLTIAILLGLFLVQRRGTAGVASFFGPVMVIWFIAIALAGLLHISDDPGVLLAINPYYGVAFLASHGTIGLATLGLFFSSSPGERLCMPISGTSAASRSRPPGSSSCCPPLSAIILGRERRCWPIRARSKIPSTDSCRSPCCYR